MPRISLDTLAASAVFRHTALAVPRLFPGPLIHRAALRVAWSGSLGEADRLFEAAARCYRARIDLVPLARLRAHQAMVRARGPSGEAGRSEYLEVERRLSRLDAIEAPWPPFELVPAASLLATWIGQSGMADAAADAAELAPFSRAA